VTVASDHQYISSSSSFMADANSMSSCGSRSHPWRLEVTAGQRILISLLDFTSGTTTQSRDLGETCRHNYGYIVDKSSRKNVSICPVMTSEDGAKPLREREVYTSGASSLNVVLLAKANTDNYNFLIKLQGNFIHLRMKCVMLTISFSTARSPLRWRSKLFQWHVH